MNKTATQNHAKAHDQLTRAIRRQAPITTIQSLQSLVTYWASKCAG